MQRFIVSKMEEWSKKANRKPLLLEGARQVGKTYALKYFGENYFKNYHYINFEDNPEYKNLFDKSLEPQRIISELRINHEIEIDIKNDFVIFDEVQQCPQAITSLKYFCENLPELKLAAAGSLLGVKLGEASFPVGKVEYLEMYPMSFTEFLFALGKQELWQLCSNLDFAQISSASHASLWDLMKIYFITGGLPESVKAYVANRDDPAIAFEAVRKVQTDLIKAYQSDIAKHSGKINSMHIEALWSSAAAQLGRTETGSANKFKFKEAIPGIVQFSRLESAMHWLLKTNLLLQSSIIHKAELPLAAYKEANQFKLFVFDVGILGALARLKPATILDYQYGTYKGFFAENFAAQEILASTKLGSDLYTWKGKSSEIEFILDLDGKIVPLEIKSGTVTKSKSLQVFIEKYKPELSFVLSGREYSFDSSYNKMYLPLYMVSLLEEALCIKLP